MLGNLERDVQCEDNGQLDLERGGCNDVVQGKGRPSADLESVRVLPRHGKYVLKVVCSILGTSSFIASKTQYKSPPRYRSRSHIVYHALHILNRTKVDLQW